MSEPTFPGCVIRIKPVALMKMRGEKGDDDKVLGVPSATQLENTAEGMDDISQQPRTEIEHFFSIYRQPEGGHVEVEGCLGADI